MRINTPKILIIDDDDDFRSMLCDLLTREDYVVTEATDGKDGMRKFREKSPDLIITDIIMPEQDGTGLIMELNLLKSTTPIIAISGGGRKTGDDYLEVARIFGANKIFEKPLNNNEFIEAVNDLLKK
jgi:DNA-binding response OmpR family regulator